MSITVRATNPLAILKPTRPVAVSLQRSLRSDTCAPQLADMGADRVTSEITYFSDSNLFLQCKPIAQLSWRDITQADLVNIVIAGAIQREIDRLKGDQGKRRAKRARAAATMLRSIVTSPDLQIELRASDPRIVVTLADPTFANSMTGASSDDQLVHEALAHQRSHPDEDVRLLTHDTGPMLSARLQALRFDEVPDAWLMEPEGDDRDRRITQLEADVRRLTSHRPEIAISVLDVAGNPATQMKLTLPQYSEMDSRDIDDLLTSVTQRFPMQVDFGPPAKERADSQIDLGSIESLFSTKWEAPPAPVIAEYRDKLYPEWLKSVRHDFESLNARLNLRDRAIELSIRLANSGEEPAENLVLEVDASGLLTLCPPKVWTKFGLGDRIFLIERPPIAPAGRYVNAAFDIPAIGQLARTRPSFLQRAMNSLPSPGDYRAEHSDPHKLYWKAEEPKELSARWVLEQEEFRPNLDPIDFGFRVVALPSNDQLDTGHLRVRVSASNLPRPVEMHLQFEILGEEKQTVDVARAWAIKPEKGNSDQRP